VLLYRLPHRRLIAESCPAAHGSALIRTVRLVGAHFLFRDAGCHQKRSDFVVVVIELLKVTSTELLARGSCGSEEILHDMSVLYGMSVLYSIGLL